jgi:hypothetical protein
VEQTILGQPWPSPASTGLWLALVSVSLLLGFAVSIVALLRSRPRGATDPTQARAEGSEVTPTLLFARRLIIQWVTFWVAPFELAKGEGSDPLTSEKCEKPKVLILNYYSGWQPPNLRVGRSNRSGRAIYLIQHWFPKKPKTIPD